MTSHKFKFFLSPSPFCPTKMSVLLRPLYLVSQKKCLPFLLPTCVTSFTNAPFRMIKEVLTFKSYRKHKRNVTWKLLLSCFNSQYFDIMLTVKMPIFCSLVFLNLNNVKASKGFYTSNYSLVLKIKFLQYLSNYVDRKSPIFLIIY